MTIVITGAAGFIGSHLSKKLEENRQTKLVLVDDFSRGKQEYLNYLDVKTKCIVGDLRKYDLAKTVTKNADIVYHLAARIGGMQYLHGSQIKEISAFQENSAIDRNVFRACIENNVDKVIFTSSVSVYNTKLQYDLNNAEFTESDTILQPIDPEGGYGWAKFIGERQLDMMSACGIKTGIARIFKAYGPCDNYSEESSNVIISLSKKAVNYPKEPFVVWGDGNATRDFFYIDDCVEALLRIEHHLKDNKKLTVNVGSGQPTSIKDIARKIVEISGKDIDIQFDVKKPSGPVSRTANISYIKKMLGWKPEMDLNEGLKRTYKWVKKIVK